MIQYADVDPQAVHALSHPLRVRMLAVIGERSLTAAQLAAELETDPRSVAQHARMLERLGFFETTKGRRGRAEYRRVRGAEVPDHVWDQAPTTAKRKMISAGLTQLHTTASAALAHGGFDRGDMHFTRTGLALDEQGWQTLSEEMLTWLARIDEIRAEGAERVAAGNAQPINATATLMLFEAATDDAAHAEEESHAPEATFSQAEALEHAFALSEELEDLLTHPLTAWARVVAIVEELRVIARAVMAQQDAARAPADRD